jgi:hypothetical protein
MTPSKRSLGYCFKRSARPEVSQVGGAGWILLVDVAKGRASSGFYLLEHEQVGQELEAVELLPAQFGLVHRELLMPAESDSADLEWKVGALIQAQEYQQKTAPC